MVFVYTHVLALENIVNEENPMENFFFTKHIH
jgi:hypothetical protein